MLFIRWGLGLHTPKRYSSIVHSPICCRGYSRWWRPGCCPTSSTTPTGTKEPVILHSSKSRLQRLRWYAVLLGLNPHVQGLDLAVLQYTINIKYIYVFIFHILCYERGGNLIFVTSAEPSYHIVIPVATADWFMWWRGEWKMNASQPVTHLPSPT